MRNTEYFTDKLRNSGLRPTKQRIKICEILFNNKETFHFSINDLAKIISENIKANFKKDFCIILCGGGRKNLTLISNLKKLINNKVYNIDEFNIDGDFVESQAFAYLSIRSLYKKNISFPNTTKVKNSITGGKLIKHI